LAVRATVEQREAWNAAVAFEHKAVQGEPEALWDAVDAYRNVLRWYTPWGPDEVDAAQALLDLAARHEQNDPELAVQALDNLRSGLIASRHLWQPRKELVAECNTRLPPLLVRVADRRGDARDKSRLLAEFQAAYARPVGVGAWVSLAVGLGFLVWIVGLVMALRRGVGEDGRWRKDGWPWVGAAVVGCATWVVALWLG
jgi:hypothetical protein